METYDYKEHLQTKLVAEFQENFYKKTGLKATVLVEQLGRRSGDLPYLSLEELDSQVSLFITPMLVPRELTLQSKSRKRHLVYLRMIYCKLARSMGYTLSTIGKQLNRDRTTVTHNLETANNLLEVDDDLFKRMFNQVVTHLRQLYSYESDPALSNPDQAPADSEPVVPALLP